MKKNRWFLLQLFAGEGGGAAGGAGASGGEGGGEGAATGGNEGVDAEHQRLLELGVPAEKLRKRAKRNSVRLPEGAVRTAQKAETNPQQVATATDPTEKTESTTPKMSWDEIMADPEYNQQMQKVVKARLKSNGAAEEAMKALAPAIELLAQRHGMDFENLDYTALAKAINDDDAYYEDKALEEGTTLAEAKRNDQQKREQAAQQRTLEQIKIQNHLTGLERQGEELKKVFPTFDLRTELKNPAFARMTAPNVGISVEAAYRAVHHKEILEASQRATAQQTAQMISNAIQAGSRRPDENGTSGQAASVTTFDYSKASKDQRDALKKAIYAAKARGEKLYPGQLK